MEQFCNLESFNRDRTFIEKLVDVIESSAARAVIEEKRNE